MKKKIVHVVEAFGGGIFTFLVDLLNNTCDEYDIVLVCSIRSETPKEYKRYFNKKIKIIEVESGVRGIKLTNDIKSFIKIKGIINEERPNIIHLHSSKFGFIGRMICNKKSYKVLYNPHGFSFLKEDEGNIKKNIYKGLEYIAAKKCGEIIGCSKGEYYAACTISSKVHLINNGIDINKLPNIKSRKINLGKIKICTVGRISYQKNPKMFNEIAKNFPEIEFTWIGDGEIREVIDSKNIKITGWLDKREVIEILNESDVFILTSLWEGLPIALLEAMYYKKICIVSNCIGNRDVIVDKVNGFVAEELNEFLSVINCIVDRKINIEQIIKKSHLDILEKYNFKIVLENYKKIYDSN
ncbi:MAG: glycosyltransferase [Clostridium sp.]